MEPCEKLSGCAFYQGHMIATSGIGDILKKKYCEAGNKENCARYQVCTQLGKEYLDNTLFPNMTDRAQEMINRYKNKKTKDKQ